MIYQLHWKLKLLQTWTEFFASNTFVFPSRYELKLQSLDWISEIWNYFTPISSIIYYSLYKNGTWRLGRIYTTIMGFLVAKKFFRSLCVLTSTRGIHDWWDGVLTFMENMTLYTYGPFLGENLSLRWCGPTFMERLYHVWVFVMAKNLPELVYGKWLDISL